MEKVKLDLPKAEFHKTSIRGVKYLWTTRSGKKERVYYIRYRAPDGKQKFETAGKKATTVAKANAIRLDRSRGTELPNRARKAAKKAAIEAEATRWTFDRLWKAWQEDPENAGKRGTKKADQRYRKYVSAVPYPEDAEKNKQEIEERKKSKFPSVLGDREPSSVAPTDVDRIRLSLARDHAKSTTISVISLIRRIERYGASTGRCSGLSFPIVLRGKTLGRDPEVKRAPTDEQVDAFIETCKSWSDPQEAAFMLLIAATGMRRSSARNLKWEDIDLDNATAILKSSKTGDLQIVLGDDAVALLRDHPRTGEFVFTGKGWEPVLDKEGNPVTHKKNGKMRRMQISKDLPQLTQRQIDRTPRMIADAAGLPADIDPCHGFRRRLATKVEAAYGIATAMKAGGWKSSAMVLNYTATTKQIVRDAVNLLGRRIPEAKEETA